MSVTVYLQPRMFGQDDEAIYIGEGAVIDVDPVTERILRVYDEDNNTVALFQEWRYALADSPDAEEAEEEAVVTEVIAMERADGTKEFYAVPVAA